MNSILMSKILKEIRILKEQINIPIPDNNPTGVESLLTIPQEATGNIQNATCNMHVLSSDISGLVISIITPNNQEINLIKNKTLTGTVISETENFQISWTGNPVGTWKLKVVDNEYHNNEKDGHIHFWSLSFTTNEGKKFEYSTSQPDKNLVQQPQPATAQPAAAQSSAEQAAQQQLYTTKGGRSIYCKDPTLMPILQKFIKYVVGKPVVVDGAFGPNSYNALRSSQFANILSNQDITQLSQNNSLCNWVANNKTTGYDLVQKIINSDAGKKAGITMDNVGSRESQKYAKKLVQPPAAPAPAPAAAPTTTKESYERYYNNKKIKDANLLYEKLINLYNNKGR